MKTLTNPVLIKLGGAAMQNNFFIKKIAQEVVYLKSNHISLLIVHGGGPEISMMCSRLGLVSEFIDGQRITDTSTIEVIKMVLAGKINKELVHIFNKENLNAVGICGVDAKLFLVDKLLSRLGSDLGFVGQVKEVNVEFLEYLIHGSYIPIIAPLGVGDDGCIYNINADLAAASLGAAMKIKSLIYITDVDGIYEDAKDPSTKFDTITKSQVEDMIDSGKITGGMIPKVSGALKALEQGIEEVYVVNGKLPKIFNKMFEEDASIGTKIILKEGVLL